MFDIGSEINHCGKLGPLSKPSVLSARENDTWKFMHIRKPDLDSNQTANKFKEKTQLLFQGA